MGSRPLVVIQAQGHGQYKKNQRRKLQHEAGAHDFVAPLAVEFSAFGHGDQTDNERRRHGGERQQHADGEEALHGLSLAMIFSLGEQVIER